MISKSVIFGKLSPINLDKCSIIAVALATMELLKDFH